MISQGSYTVQREQAITSALSGEVSNYFDAHSASRNLDSGCNSSSYAYTLAPSSRKTPNAYNRLGTILTESTCCIECFGLMIRYTKNYE